MGRQKRKLNKRELTLALYGYIGLIIFMSAILLFLYPLIIGQHRVFFGFFLMLDIFCLVFIWHKREMFFGVVEIQEDGILNRCFCKRTVFVPWAEIEQLKIGWICTGVVEHHLFLNVIRKESKTFHRSKANITNGFDYHIALDEQSIKLLKEYLPQRLKEMLGPHAFD